MKLTAKGRYAVMAVSDIASQRVEGAESVAVSLSDISSRQNISIAYLEQIFGQLRKAGLVNSTRGASGGYRLSVPASQLTLDKVIFAVNEDIRAHGCTPEIKASCTGQSSKCLTHGLWGAMERHIEGFLASITIDDVVAQRFSPELETI